MQIAKSAILVRNLVFGIEDSLVSTIGLLAGVTSAGIDKGTIIITGVILIFVEAFSMAAGSLLSEMSAEEYVEKHEVSLNKSFFGSIVMFISYIISGFIILMPYILLDVETAFVCSIILALLALVSFGAFAAYRLKIPIGHNVARMLIVGGLAIVVGIFIGRLVK